MPDTPGADTMCFPNSGENSQTPDDQIKPRNKGFCVPSPLLPPLRWRLLQPLHANIVSKETS